jgi:hypothetical protein
MSKEILGGSAGATKVGGGGGIKVLVRTCTPPPPPPNFELALQFGALASLPSFAARTWLPRPARSRSGELHLRHPRRTPRPGRRKCSTWRRTCASGELIGGHLRRKRVAAGVVGGGQGRRSSTLIARARHLRATTCSRSSATAEQSSSTLPPLQRNRSSSTFFLRSHATARQQHLLFSLARFRQQQHSVSPAADPKQQHLLFALASLVRSGGRSNSVLLPG